MAKMNKTHLEFLIKSCSVDISDLRHAMAGLTLVQSVSIKATDNGLVLGVSMREPATSKTDVEDLRRIMSVNIGNELEWVF